MTNIRTERERSVGIITIDRRDRFNSLDVNTARDLRKAGLQFARDENVRVVVLRGSGGVFCSGADLKYIREGGDENELRYMQPDTARGQYRYGEGFKQIVEYIHSTISEIRRAPKPFIAAVDGIAAAGGFGLAMACDLVVASERAAFEWAYARTGLSGAESTTFMLPRLIGFQRSFEMLLLNPRVEAREALQLGLVSRVFRAEGFDAEVLHLAKQIAAGPTDAYAVAKELLNHAAGMERLDMHLDRELEHLTRIADGAGVAEGIDAFFAKRPARFGGS